MFPKMISAASLVFLVALAASTGVVAPVLGASSPSPTASSASNRVTVESLSEALEEIVAEVEAETDEVHDIIEKLDEELQGSVFLVDHHSVCL